MLGSLIVCTFAVSVSAQLTDGMSDESTNWQQAEVGILANHMQLTFADRFVKAGESYFSPDDSKVIFQAVELPPQGEAADPFYAMIVADIVRDDDGRITGIDNIKRLSPPGSANTCGWFHPTDPNVVLFASTVDPPVEQKPPGFVRDTQRYRWMFPPEMKIVRCELDNADGTAETIEVIYGNDSAYQAEASLTKDGQHLLFCDLTSNAGDLFIKDLTTGNINRIVQARGYDGGPFFSPDDKRICYRSDRRGDHYLQLFIGELARNERGEIVGLSREYQITDNGHVNWAPFWHPDGRFLVYATSEVGHHNYEIFLLDADPGDLEGSNGTIKYGTRRRRITHAANADVLPAFSADGSVMIWTSQRGADGESQLWVADFVIELDSPGAADVSQRSTP